MMEKLPIKFVHSVIAGQCVHCPAIHNLGVLENYRTTHVIANQ